MTLLQLALAVLVSSLFLLVVGALSKVKRGSWKWLVPLVLAHALVASVLARAHVFEVFDTLPPRLLVFAIGTLVAGALLSRTRALSGALERMPSWWPIAIQGFRLPIELILWGLWMEGVLPKQMTFEGQNFDVLVGLSGPVVAWLLATGRISVRVARVWNVMGALLLLNVMRIAITSFPGPLHFDWPGEPLTIVATFPFVFIPSLMVPLAAWGHLATWKVLGREASPGALGAELARVAS